MRNSNSFPGLIVRSKTLDRIYEFKFEVKAYQPECKSIAIAE